MVECTLQLLLTTSASWWEPAYRFVLTNLTTVGILVLALVIVRRIFSEKRTPSNFFAWLLLIVFAPLLGVPLYLLFGGRKSSRITRIKRQVTAEARALTAPEASTQADHCVGTSAAPTHGNHFELLPDGEHGFARLCECIENAQHTIHMATFILSKDATGLAIVERLARRAREGVRVRLLLDSLGCWNSTRTLRRRLRQAGGEVAMFMPVLPLQPHFSANLRNHRKLAIFDHRLAISGGQNIDIRFMGAACDPQRFVDFNVITQGPAVAALTRTFISDWAFASRQPVRAFRSALCYQPDPVGESSVEVIASGPDVEDEPLWEALIRIVQEFQQSLTIITPYFVPDEVLFQSLLVKAHTGRRIRLVVPLRSNHPLTDIARHTYLRQLAAAGVEILFYHPRMLHAKLIIADQRVALVGSANIDMRSLFVNFEIGLLHYSPDDIASLARWAEQISADSMTYEEAQRSTSLQPNKVIERLVHLVSPLL